ncbi:hypothetical protein BDZ89DRAFT_1171720 [Hymenopellis radicata]|nr:hypothetical protein BDZ89DRAFT_1171720 [Hymenopellis radicata]
MNTPFSCGNCGVPIFQPKYDICSTTAYQRFAGTNAPLSDLDAELFRDEVLSRAECDLALIEREQADIRAVMAAMEQEKQRLKENVRKCRSVLSRLRCFPNELLLEIFHFTSLLDVSQGPWLVSRVCSAWRNLVLSSPFLWTRIALRSVGGKLYSPSLLKHVLSLSGTLPLSIELEVTFSGMADGMLRSCLRELAASAERWKRVYIYIDPEYVQDELFGNIRRLPALEELELCLSHVEDHHLGPIEMFNDAPSLKRVTLTDINFDVLNFPLSGLTHVQENDTYSFMNPLSRCRLYLSSCPSLISLRITHQFIYEFETESPSTLTNGFTIQHNSLRYLYLSDAHSLNAVTLPSLEKLHIKCPLVENLIGSRPPCPDTMLAAIKNFIVRSRCSLKSLRVMDVQDAHQLEDVLQFTPDLTELKVRYNHWQVDQKYDAQLSAFLRSRAHSTNAEQLVPKLRSFILRIYAYPFEPDVPPRHTVEFLYYISDFVSCRCSKDGYLLKKLSIAFLFDADVWTNDTSHQIRWLREINKAGLVDVSLTSRGDINDDVGYTGDPKDSSRLNVRVAQSRTEYGRK